jgi:hypothetical protein
MEESALAKRCEARAKNVCGWRKKMIVVDAQAVHRPVAHRQGSVVPEGGEAFAASSQENMRVRFMWPGCR